METLSFCLHRRYLQCKFLQLYTGSQSPSESQQSPAIPQMRHLSVKSMDILFLHPAVARNGDRKDGDS